MFKTGGSDCDDSDPLRWEVGPSGLYNGEAYRLANDHTYDYYVVIDGQSWDFGGGGGNTGTFDDQGIIDSYTRTGCTGTCEASGSICGGQLELVLRWYTMYGTDGIDFTGTVD